MHIYLAKIKSFLTKHLIKRLNTKILKNLKDALKKVCSIVKKNKFTYHTILFSPSAASFDSFKNFEERGYYFNKLIKKYFNGF